MNTERRSRVGSLVNPKEESLGPFAQHGTMRVVVRLLFHLETATNAASSGAPLSLSLSLSFFLYRFLSYIHREGCKFFRVRGLRPARRVFDANQTERRR